MSSNCVIENSAIQSLLSDFSIEITVSEAKQVARFQDFLPPGTEVFIVATPTTIFDDVVTLARRLRDHGMVPVPHIAARAIPNMDFLDRVIRNLCNEANVTSALIIAGGNYGTPSGTFVSSMDVLNSGILAAHGIQDLRFAGHPEGHPKISNSILLEVLKEKQLYGQRNQVATSLVTQFFFDFSVVAAWAANLASCGIRMPIRPGLHGVISLASLIRQAHYCGVGRSIEQLTKQPSKMLKLASVTTPETLITSMALHAANTRETLISGCHFFPLGNFKKTAKWAFSIVQGNFDIGLDGSIITENQINLR
jgi:methylenetetrahydrofolate reductase (NADPH)